MNTETAYRITGKGRQVAKALSGCGDIPVFTHTGDLIGLIQSQLTEDNARPPRNHVYNSEDAAALDEFFAELRAIEEQQDGE